MAACDFVVRHDTDTETMEALAKKILQSVILGRLKAKKPAVIFISGDSGEGKSYSALRIIEVLFELQGLDIKDFFDVCNVMVPLEYPDKLTKILYDKEFKKCNIICMHEARDIVRAKNWQSFLTQAIADVNAMSRAMKRMCVIIVSQFIRDITTDVRYTLNYYIKVSRPKGRNARLYINVMWKDDRDLEKPKLRKRKLSGYIVDKKGKYRHYIPKYLEVRKPNKELREMFDKADYDAKAVRIRQKMNKLIEDMKAEIGDESKKIEAMVEYYTKHTDNLQMIGKQSRGKWKLQPNARDMHGITKEEASMFEGKLNEKLKKMGFFGEADGQEKQSSE